MIQATVSVDQYVQSLHDVRVSHKLSIILSCAAVILCSLYLFHKRKLFVYFPRVGVVNIDFILDDNDSTFFFLIF